MTDTQKKESTEQEKLYADNFLIWLGILILFFIGMGVSNFFTILTLAPFFGVWATKTIKTKNTSMIQRMKSFKHYKTRTVISVIILLFCGGLLAGNIATMYESIPTINVASGESTDIGTGSTYKLDLQLTDTKELTINGEKIAISGNVFSKEYNLDYKTGLNLRITAKNTIKTSEKTLTVVRNLSENEIAKIEADKVAQAKAEAEKKAKEEERMKQAEEERKKQEAYMNSPEYKAQQEKELLNKTLADRKSDMKYTCTEGVKLMLKSPSTADFPSITSFRFGIVKNQILVQSYVDSQNSFGAELRTNFICYFAVKGGNVDIVDIQFE